MLTRNPLIAVLLTAATLSPVLAQQEKPALAIGAPQLFMPALGSTSSMRSLIKRSDVQGILRLDLKQKSALNELLNNPQRSGLRLSITAQGAPDPSDIRKQIEDQIASQVNGMNDQLKAILHEDQYDRLVELDLQWRGVLALADSKVAERLKISPETRRGIAPIASQYQEEKQKVMMDLMKTAQTTNENGQFIVRAQGMTKDLENPLTPSYKRLDAAKKAAEEKLWDVLKPEEKEAWKKAQGAPFAFRTDLPGHRF